MFNDHQTTKFFNNIKCLLKSYHENFSTTMKGELAEEIFALSFNAAGMKSSWTNDFNHKPGSDQTITLENGETVRVSNKSGKINSKKIPL